MRISLLPQISDDEIGERFSSALGKCGMLELPRQTPDLTVEAVLGLGPVKGSTARPLGPMRVQTDFGVTHEEEVVPVSGWR